MVPSLGAVFARNRGALGASAHHSAQPMGAHQPLDPAAPDPVTQSVQVLPHLPGPVDAVVGRVLNGDDLPQARVTDRPRRRWPGPGGVAAERGDLQLPADRLDPKRGSSQSRV